MWEKSELHALCIPVASSTSQQCLVILCWCMQHYYCKTILFSEEEKKGTTRINDIGKEPSFWAEKVFCLRVIVRVGWEDDEKNLNRILFSPSLHFYYHYIFYYFNFIIIIIILLYPL